MRIISGTAKGKKLHLFKGRQIRPTADRIREAIFSSLQSRFGSFRDLKVLDLFAGTGALALEALSRGAKEAILVDRSSLAASLIKANIAACDMQQRARFFRSPVSAFLPRLEEQEPFDLIFLDPPYNQNLVVPTLTEIANHRLLTATGLVCAETSREEAPAEPPRGLTLSSRREYGTTSVLFYTLSIAGDNNS